MYITYHSYMYMKFIFIESFGGGGGAPRGIKKMINKFSFTAYNKKFAIVFANNICMNAQVIKR